MPSYVYLQMLLATFLWGTAFPVAKTALQHAGPFTLAGLRLTTAGVLLLLSSLVLPQRSTGKLGAAAKVHWPRVLAIALLSTTSFYGVFFLGMARTSAASGAAMDATGPIINAIVAHFVLHDDRLSPRRIIAILLAFSGVLIIALTKHGGGTHAVSAVGCALILLGLMFNSAGTMLVVTYRGRFTMERLTGAQMAIGGSILLLIAHFREVPLHRLRVPVSYYVEIFWLAIVSAVAFRLWFGLIRKYKVTSLAVFSFLTGLWGVLLSVIFLHDRLTPQFLVGLCAVIGGVVLMNSEKISHRRSVPADA